jgi:2-polyprenyl-6-methoxyphenol hydroxylase-like FAD-dependent oxidoreductase
MGLRVLISGGGIAGLAAANYLHRRGHAVTVIEKAPAFQKLGYALSMKSFGIKLLTELGLRDELDRHGFPPQAIHIYEADGTLLKTYSGEFAQEACMGSAPILRSELHDILFRAVKDFVPVRFGLQPKTLEQPGDGGGRGRLRVTFSNGDAGEFDLKVTRPIEALNANGFVFYDAVAMIQLPELSRGCVVFMGDAGYCPTFLSGMGASLGLLGAKVLSGALADTADVPAALARYGAVMTPVIRHFHHTAHANVEALLTESGFKIAIRDALMHLLPPSIAGIWVRKQLDVEEKLLHGII